MAAPTEYNRLPRLGFIPVAIGECGICTEDNQELLALHGARASEITDADGPIGFMNGRHVVNTTIYVDGNTRNPTGDGFVQVPKTLPTLVYNDATRPLGHRTVKVLADHTACTTCINHLSKCHICRGPLKGGVEAAVCTTKATPVGRATGPSYGAAGEGVDEFAGLLIGFPPHSVVRAYDDDGSQALQALLRRNFTTGARPVDPELEAALAASLDSYYDAAARPDDAELEAAVAASLNHAVIVRPDFRIEENEQLQQLTRGGWVSWDVLRDLDEETLNNIIINTKDILILKDKGVSFDSILRAKNWFFKEYCHFDREYVSLERAFELSVGYHATTPLGTLYMRSLILADELVPSERKGPARDDVVGLVLSDQLRGDRGNVLEFLWRENGEIPGDPAWAEHNILYNEFCLLSAVRKAIMMKYLALPVERQRELERHLPRGELLVSIARLADFLSR